MANQKIGRPQRTARIGSNSRVHDDLVLSPRPEDWSAFLDSAVRASDDFMEGVDDLPVQERAD